jgi:putative two-component system hydrogenase maturation factor HypX/HoxX
LRILFLTHSFNSLAQRLWVELTALGHELAMEFDIADAVAIDACALFRPDLVIAPFLKRRIPEAVWQRHVCLVVHPGIAGDRGPSALDWAILKGEREWGVTVLQANEVMDGGPIWATRTFPMRAARKSSLYRNEVTEAAVAAVLEAVDKFAAGDFQPLTLDDSDPQVRGREHRPMKQEDRRIDWLRDPTATVLAKLRSADSVPGVLDEIRGLPVHLYNAVEERSLRGTAGEILATRHGAILRATVDGAVWISHLKLSSEESGFKLPAATVLGERLAGVPELPLPALPRADDGTWQDIGYEEADGVGYLHFPVYNGALSTAGCLRLRDAVVEAGRRGPRVLVLMGGPDFWCNGIHLNTIEAADSPADESWANIEAMDDLCLAILESERFVVAAMRGNGGAGGVFLALAADEVWARRGVVLNPHYKGMGNLYGSEYWTYLLPRRVGAERAQSITRNRLPIGAPQALTLGLIDACFGDDLPGFKAEVRVRAARIAADPGLAARLAEKCSARSRDEAQKPLAAYRAEELGRMKLNFYGFDPSYHVARYHFVHRLPHAWTPLHLARHRRDQWQQQALLRSRAAGA